VSGEGGREGGRDGGVLHVSVCVNISVCHYYIITLPSTRGGRGKEGVREGVWRHGCRPGTACEYTCM